MCFNYQLIITFNYQLIITFKNQLQVNYEQLHKGGGRGEKIEIFLFFSSYQLKFLLKSGQLFLKTSQKAR